MISDEADELRQYEGKKKREGREVEESFSCLEGEMRESETEHYVPHPCSHWMVAQRRRGIYSRVLVRRVGHSNYSDYSDYSTDTVIE